MRVLVTGATGTIGQAVVQRLLERGDHPVALSRDPGRAQRTLGHGVEAHPWGDPTQAPPLAPALAATDAVVHLLGEPVSQRWSDAAKRAIRDSRVLSTRQLVGALRQLPDGARPRVFVSQSATGYYGPSDDTELDEGSPAGSDFLAKVVVEWEREARAASELTRVVLTRTGVVLSPSGGALAQMLPFFRLGLGGPVAGGRQYVPWIHLDDVAGGILHCLDDPSLEGPVNLTAPRPVTNKDLSRALGRALHRPAVLPVPSPALKLLYGEMAQIVLTGQRVVPRRLTQSGYRFAHPEVAAALRDVLNGR